MVSASPRKGTVKLKTTCMALLEASLKEVMLHLVQAHGMTSVIVKGHFHRRRQHYEIPPKHTANS